jgi:hypothetical protein
MSVACLEQRAFREGKGVLRASPGRVSHRGKVVCPRGDSTSQVGWIGPRGAWIASLHARSCSNSTGRTPERCRRCTSTHARPDVANREEVPNSFDFGGARLLRPGTVGRWTERVARELHVGGDRPCHRDPNLEEWWKDEPTSAGTAVWNRQRLGIDPSHRRPARPDSGIHGGAAVSPCGTNLLFCRIGT